MLPTTYGKYVILTFYFSFSAMSEHQLEKTLM